MNDKRIEEYKKNLKLTKLQKEIIVGSLLGDGHLESGSKGRVYRLKIQYGEKQREYIYWLWRVFRGWVGQDPRAKSQVRPSGKVVRTLYFNTYSHSAFRFYGHQFYSKTGKKVNPRIIRKLITPLGLAIWFMDDGSWKSQEHKTYIIHTDGYSRKDLVRVKEALEQKFGLSLALHRQYGNWRLYVLTKSAKRFRSLVEKYILASMRYKLGNISPKE